LKIDNIDIEVISGWPYLASKADKSVDAVATSPIAPPHFIRQLQFNDLSMLRKIENYFNDISREKIRLAYFYN